MGRELEGGGGEAAFETVGATEELIEAVFDTIKREVPGAGVVDLVATEGFFVLSEAIPRVFRIGRSGDAPEIEKGGVMVLGVENHLDEEDGAGHEFAVFGVGAGVSVITHAIIIVNEGGGDRLMLIVDDVKGGEAAFELIFEMFFGLGGEMVAFAETI